LFLPVKKNENTNKKYSMEKTRLISIVISKAICIILVVVGHYHPDNSPNLYSALNSMIYSFHMPLFMFVSGYLYWATRKPVAYKDFVWKKFQRLMIPYFFASIVIIAIKLLTERSLLVENPVTFSAFYQMFYLPVAGFFLWFAFALFLIFLLVPLFNTHKRLLFLLGISLILYFIPVEFPEVFCLAQLKTHLLWFVLGCTISEWVNVRQRISKVHFLIAFCVFAGIFVAKSYIDNHLINNLLSALLAVIGIVFIANLSRYIGKQTVKVRNLLVDISLYSYTIYLFHTTFEGLMKSLINKTITTSCSSNNVINVLVFFMIATVVIFVGVVGPIIVHKIAVRYSRLFSFLIGTKFMGRPATAST